MTGACVQCGSRYTDTYQNVTHCYTCGHQQEGVKMSLIIECPNHGGSFDCTPFCAICEGNQEYEVTQ